MRALILASAGLMAFASASLAMPVAPLRILSAVPVHGCHHNYGQDTAGWHRHGKECRILRGVVDQKKRPSTKS